MEIDHGFFRRESARLVGLLAKRYGYRHLESVEDAVGDALLRATEVWEESGVPENPAGWLLRVAERRLIDVIRRSTRYRKRVEPWLQREADAAVPVFAGVDAANPEPIDPDIELLFACSHPAIPVEGRLSLALRTVFALSVGEIASLLESSYETTQKRLYRARQVFRDPVGAVSAPAAIDVPPHRLSSRTDSVLRTLYLVFTRSYRLMRASEPDEAIRGVDLAADVLARVDALVGSSLPLGAEPRGAANALAALVCFHLARHANRPEEPTLPLDLIDRSGWDRGLLEVAVSRLERAREANRISRYHLEAAIAAEHSLALSWDETDWTAILGQYELLARFGLSLHARLGRAIARSFASGDRGERRAAFDEVESIASGERAGNNLELQATRGLLARRAGDERAAEEAFARAEAIANTPTERQAIIRLSSRAL